MSDNLKNVLGLPDCQPATLSGQGEQFAKEFRQKIADLNADLRGLADRVSQDRRRPLVKQRDNLIQAYQQTAAKIDPADPAKSNRDIERVCAAVIGAQQKVAQIAAEATTQLEDWLAIEADFEQSLEQIGELEEAKHTKAPALRKLGDAIRNRANERKYDESTSALEKMRPKLSRIVQKQTQQTADACEAKGETTPLAAADRDKLWRELEELDRLLDRAAAGLFLSP